MNGVDERDIDEAIATAFTVLKGAVETHSHKSIEAYSHALRALVELRREVASGNSA
ncbi:hypothetical protein GL263_18040 [Streptomyces durbertensis]|uniref:Uncharacterized protein n=1 Tax=Streptomyces durbertensis TaxID=2448886 RepID=A0ABR6EJF4_9ACTN|nr:hypothetical protein [Streptomyces durbertensis]MBB1245450.1 hypothetical protein [Streptomyces durbertensis]